jgi:hypothetical protein
MVMVLKFFLTILCEKRATMEPQFNVPQFKVLPRLMFSFSDP